MSSINWLPRRRHTDTSAGSRDTRQKALTVLPRTALPAPAVTTETPVENR
jgi:hypothetical protein